MCQNCDRGSCERRTRGFRWWAEPTFFPLAGAASPRYPASVPASQLWRFCAASNVVSTSLFPTTEVQAAGPSETLLLSLSPRSCRTHCSCIAVEPLPGPTSGLQAVRVSSSPQSFGYTEGIASLTAHSRCHYGLRDVNP